MLSIRISRTQLAPQKCQSDRLFLWRSQCREKAYTTSGSAQHVGVQLLKSDNTAIIEPNTQMPEGDAQQLQAGNNELNFYARLIALDNGVTPGDFTASVTYTLKYL